MTHLQQTCAAMVSAQMVIDRLSNYRRDLLRRRGLEPHANDAKNLILMNQDILRGLGLRLTRYPAANDATTLPGAA